MSRPYRMVARAEAAQATADRVLEVAFELFTERPYDDVSLEEIAAHAGVTKRTVLRRFGSKEELFLAQGWHMAEKEMGARYEAQVGDVVAAVAGLVASYERIGMNRLRMIAQEDRIAIVAEDVKLGRRNHREWVERIFAPLIDGVAGAKRRRRVMALLALTDVYMWKLLRHDHRMSRVETERTLVELINNVGGD